MPVTYKKRTAGKVTPGSKEENDEIHDEIRQCFVFRNYCLSLLRPRGNTYEQQPIPGF